MSQQIIAAICQIWQSKESTLYTLHLSEEDRIMYVYKNQEFVKKYNTLSSIKVIIEKDIYDTLIACQPLHGIQINKEDVKLW